MSRRVQGSIIGVVGLAALWMVLSGDLVFYVRDRMRLPMILTGLVLVTVGILTVWPSTSETPHEHMPKAAWLLVVPVLAMIAFTPGPLGADSADTSSVVVFDPAGEYGPLPGHGARPVELSLSEFWERALYDPHHSVRGREIRVVAFAVLDSTPARLGRYLISCCAADATLLSVDVARWPGPAPDQGQWLSAVVRQHGRAAKGR